MAQAVQNGEQGAPHLPHICVTSQVPALPSSCQCLASSVCSGLSCGDRQGAHLSHPDMEVVRGLGAGLPSQAHQLCGARVRGGKKAPASELGLGAVEKPGAI